MKRALIVLIIFILTFTFSGCLENTSILNGSSKTSSLQETNSDTKTIGIIALGDYENYNEYSKAIKTSPYLDEYEFLGKLSTNEFITASEGTQTFAILPTDTIASVSVYKLEHDNELNKATNGDLLYNSSDVKPFVVKCNFSDIFPDVNIVLTAKDGSVTQFSPKISMKDGRVEIVTETKSFIKDLTKY